mgnify:CR=1 FL=1
MSASWRLSRTYCAEELNKEGHFVNTGDATELNKEGHYENQDEHRSTGDKDMVRT